MPGDIVDLRSFAGLLRRRFLQIAAVLAGCFALAGLAVLVIQPVYTATALILVDPSKKDLLDPEQQVAGTGSDSLRVDSEVELVKSETVLRAVARELSLTADSEFGPRLGLIDTALAALGMAEPKLPTGDAALRQVTDRLRDAVSVDRRALTFLIAVDARSGRPQLAAEIANAVARHYIREQLEAKIASTLAARDIIQARATEASKALAASESALDSFVQANADRLGEAVGQSELRQAILTSALPSDILAAVYELQQNADLARGNYQTLLTRQNELDTQAFLQVADSRIVSAATAPSRPSLPNPATMLLLAGIAGLAIGVGIALLRENFVGGFTSAPQAEAILKVPVITATPRQRSRKRDGAEALSVADTLVVAPLSAYSESIRRIRAGLDQALQRTRGSGAAGGAIIAVSSAAPGEGKTTLALSLARAYALSGVSTLLVDCDLRRPSIHRQLGLEASGGLLEYLSGADQAADLQAIMTNDAGSGAQVVLGSHRADTATDQLIAGRRLSRVLDTARQNFDVVILDTPPVGAVVDGLYLAGMADAILFVVRWSGTPQQEVRSAVSALVAAKPDTTPVLAVLNQQDTNPRARRGKYAAYYAEA